MTTRLVYISGFGRSGSSILDRMLGEASGAVSTGELCNLYAWACEGRECSCGSAIMGCELWGPIVKSTRSRTGMSLGDMAHATSSAETRCERMDDWRRVWEATFAGLRESPIPNLIIDSSKTAGRGRLQLLSGLPNVEVVANVHLIRSLGGVVHSFRRGTNRQLESRSRDVIRAPALKATYGWWRANLTARRQSRYATRTVVIRYEDFVTEHVMLLETLVRSLDLNTDERPLVGHEIAGNRSLRSGPMDVHLDTEWQYQESPLTRAAVRLVESLSTRVGVTPRSDI